MANAALPRRLGRILLAIGLLAAIAIAAFFFVSRSLEPTAPTPAFCT